jgi:hypothetical protein
VRLLIAAAAIGAAALAAGAGATVSPREGPYSGFAENHRPVTFGFTRGRLVDFVYGGRRLFRSARLRPGGFVASGPKGVRVAGRWTSPTRVAGTIQAGRSVTPYAASWAAP